MYRSFFILVVSFIVLVSGADHQVTVMDNSFSPQNLTASAGDTVTWNFEGTHSVTQQTAIGDCFPSAKGALINSGVKDSGESYTITLSNPGTFHYFCSIGNHCKNGMQGSIILKPGNGTSSVSSSSTSSTTMSSPTTTTEGDGVFFESSAIGNQKHNLVITLLCTMYLINML